ncbi:MAG: hypothetical protein RSD35_06845 [Oscillospiraceae bacterium]
MTKKELMRLRWLNREIESEKERLAQLKSAATDISPKITGLPHVGVVANKTAIAAKIADSRDIIDTKVLRSIAEYNRLNRYIASIDDSYIRQILTLRYVDGLSWVAVAFHMGGSEDSVRKTHDRFLRSEQ